MKTKFCIYCGCDKPFDPTQKRWSKASGFFGGRCWDCQKETVRKATKAYYAKKKVEKQVEKVLYAKGAV